MFQTSLSGMRPLTPFMRQQIRVHHQLQGPPRIETRPEFRPLARPEAAPTVEVIRGLTSREFHRPGPGGLQPSPGVTTPEVIRGRAARNFRPPGSEGFQPAPFRNFRQPVGEGFRGVSPRRIPQTSGFRAFVPREFRAAPPPFSRFAPRATFGTRPPTPVPGRSAPARSFSPSFRR